MLIEEMISTASNEDLEKIGNMIRAESYKRQAELFAKEKNKVLTALKSFKENFPFGAINLNVLCLSCGDSDIENILDCIDDLEFSI